MGLICNTNRYLAKQNPHKITDSFMRGFMERRRVASRTSSDNAVITITRRDCRTVTHKYDLIAALTLIISVTDVTCSPFW